MNNLKWVVLFLSISFAVFNFSSCTKSENQQLAQQILNDSTLVQVHERALDILESGFSAGDKYTEVWIRDFNTFVELSCQVYDEKIIKENILTFFKFQGNDGNIVDGYAPVEKAFYKYDFIKSDLAPEYLAHKNTVETDQEASLVQCIHKYIRATGDKAILQQEIAGKKVIDRLEMALNFLLNERYDEKYGLIWGATTADWGDVQPEHDWGVVLDETSHKAIDIYDNAMFLIAVQNYIEMLDDASQKQHWQQVYDKTKANARKYLWDEKAQKFIPHVYLNGSPFPADFDENAIYYHGGTAVAIEAGILTHEEILVSLNKMVANVNESGAPTIGLTVYPPYPAGFFKNKHMSVEYIYQNGGDWTWFGGRMIQVLVEYGYAKEAYREIRPMIQRVMDNDGFYEWYTKDNEPKGAGTFRGSAGVLGKAIEMLWDWAEENK